jgi:hypothetical protein
MEGMATRPVLVFGVRRPSMNHARRKIAIMLLLIFILPRIAIADESIKPGTFTQAGIGAIAGGVLLLVMANNTEKSHDDSTKYGQDSVQDRANMQRTLGLAGILFGVSFLIAGTQKTETASPLSFQVGPNESGISAAVIFSIR